MGGMSETYRKAGKYKRNIPYGKAGRKLYNKKARTK
jgi:hypothetical protein